MKKIGLIILSATLALSINAQNSILGDLYFRNIGPANQGGRIVDIEASTIKPEMVYVATGSGGVFKSVNAGTTWTPIFDKYETASIGDIALDPKDHNTIWVGTGEANNRNSVSWGNGIYKSEDGGITFVNKGLENTHQIARVLVNPKNNKEVCACAIGHLWGYTGDRGLFMTKDDGSTWQKITNGLPDDGKTGCTDLVRDPKNSNILYAAFYHRLRQPWDFYSGGEQGGIYKSMDGGKTWNKLSNGLPTPTGRIGLAVSNSKPNVLMAIVEAKRTSTLDTLGSGIYRSSDAGKTWKYVNTYNNRPFYYSQIRLDPQNDSIIYVHTTNFMVSKDAGKTFKNGSPDYEIHGDYHAQWINPDNPNHYYIGSDKGLAVTYDKGQNFQLLDNLSIAQFYRIQYDMDKPYRIYGGLQDNGSYAVASSSRDARGILSDHNWKMHWGDGMDALVNPFNKNEVYTSSENGNYMRYNPSTRELSSIVPDGFNILNLVEKIGDVAKFKLRYNWSAPMAMSPHNPDHIYLGGNYLFKSTDKGNSWRIISGDLSTKDTIKTLSDQSGGITPDNTGAENHCSIYKISISKVNEDIIWVCTDDGLVHVTFDGGQEWSEVSPTIDGAKNPYWCSGVEASSFDSKRAYLTVDGHRSDVNKPYVFVTNDGGKTWKTITTGIQSHEVARVIREDKTSANLLFLGTETGVYFSINMGTSWSKIVDKGLPTVSVYDIKVHERDNDLIIGTHGRGIYIMDDISPLQYISNNNSSIDIVLPTQKPVIDWLNISRGGQRGHFLFAGENPKYIRNTSSVPRAEFYVDVPVSFIVNDNGIKSVDILITSLNGDRKFKENIPVKYGINRWYWDRNFDQVDYTNVEISEILSIFEKAGQVSFTNKVKIGKTQFVNAKTTKDKKNVLTMLNQTVLGGLIPNHYLAERASLGSYQVSIVYKDLVLKQGIRIEKDNF
jgi:photosystem II stability/assembly factor-like uncharacterized protein